MSEVAVIYITENLHNKEHGILPWRYIGSDQCNNSNYMGSSVALKNDIKTLGVEKFEKRILVDLGDIDNKELRKIEADNYLRPNNVREDETYYNKTDHYAPGCVKGTRWKQNKPRSEEHIAKIVEHRTGSIKSDSARQLMRERKLGTKAKDSTKKLMSEAHAGEKNRNSLSWEVIGPDGTTYFIKGLRKWCRDNNIDYYMIYNNRRGWSSVKHGTGNNAGRKHSK